MMENNMSLLLPPGTTTYPRSRTTIDLTWGNEMAACSIIKCGIAGKHDHGSDHLPIQITLNLEPQQVGNGLLPPYNHDETDWKELEMKLRKYLPRILDSSEATPATIDTYANNLVEATTKAIQETTTRKQISPHSKR
jgi:hypothetical protein